MQRSRGGGGKRHRLLPRPRSTLLERTWNDQELLLQRELLERNLRIGAVSFGLRWLIKGGNIVPAPLRPCCLPPSGGRDNWNSGSEVSGGKKGGIP